MANTLVESQLTLAHDTLKDICGNISEYLNGTTLSDMLSEDGQSDEEFFKAVLSSLRRVLVFCEEGKEASEVILNGKTFRKAAAEKTLYWIYHHCIEEFFNPRIDNWYEDSRSAYTGKNAIKFSKSVPNSLKDLMKTIEGPFQSIREELEYYETDFQTKMIHSK
ncbi:hypothetical protein BTR23_01170 [Alkalihalophilus pseudofirmus]|uniref:DUF3907 family protein n=1 Tax=Alkalihalobacterium alkalinitrilicum TaxID=427920 RepID=UPI00094C4EB2|nr:DUF3907 family protein [Alkalihalobacterium alkalinitrilicum]OLO42652.1 hypothetical protein BTR23_01170 [Alkalihalophilus pseudofirmus]